MVLISWVQTIIHYNKKKTDLLANPLVGCWLLDQKTLYFCFSVFRLSKWCSNAVQDPWARPVEVDWQSPGSHICWSVDLLDIFFGHCRASWCQSWGSGWALAYFLEPTITVEYVVPLKIEPPKIDIDYILGCPLFASTMYLMPDDLGTSPKWNSLLRQIQKVWLENICIYTHTVITGFQSPVLQSKLVPIMGERVGLGQGLLLLFLVSLVNR